MTKSLSIIILFNILTLSLINGKINLDISEIKDFFNGVIKEAELEKDIKLSDECFGDEFKKDAEYFQKYLRQGKLLILTSLFMNILNDLTKCPIAEIKKMFIDNLTNFFVKLNQINPQWFKVMKLLREEFIRKENTMKSIGITVGKVFKIVKNIPMEQMLRKVEEEYDECERLRVELNDKSKNIKFQEYYEKCLRKKISPSLLDQ